MYILGKAKISLLENNIEKYENSLKGRILEKQHIEQLTDNLTGLKSDDLGGQQQLPA